MIQTHARNASLQDTVELLTAQNAAKLDIVVPATKMFMKHGVLVVKGAEAEITETGVTQVDGEYRPTKVFNDGVAQKLGIPTKFLTTVYEDRSDIYDQLVNGFLHGSRPFKAADGTITKEYPADERNFLVRLFRGEDGIARAFLSDKYDLSMDNFDVLLALLDGLREAGIDNAQVKADVSERRMAVRVNVPELLVHAPESLISRYHDPRSGNAAIDNPGVSAGLLIGNSETGGGAYTILPYMTLLICTNGMTMTQDILRSVHLGGRLDQGVINWGADTQAKAVDLVKLKTRDAVTTFLNEEYMTKTLAVIAGKAAKPVDDAVKTIETISKKLAYSQEDAAGILQHFIKGGQADAGGIFHAITSYVQDVADADKAYDMELSAIKALDLV